MKESHFSPLRYPGGKAFLAPFLSSVIAENNAHDSTYIEPFCGGAGAALTLLINERIESIHLNDYDPAIYSLWRSILTRTQEFQEKIERADISIKEWSKQLAIYRDRRSKQIDLGFAAFFLNRTNRSGIIEGGPIGGMQQAGEWRLDARFNKSNLIERVERIASYRDRIKVTNQDGIEVMKNAVKFSKPFVYIDPPYFNKGSSLYLNHFSANEHRSLAQYLNKCSRLKWLLTYDDTPEIRSLYSSRRTSEFSLSYHIGIPKRGNELLILSDSLALPLGRISLPRS